MSENIIYKSCSKCKREQPLTNFFSRSNICKSCKNSYQRSKSKVEAKIKGSTAFYTQKWRALWLGAKRRNIPFKLKAGDIREIYKNADKPCPYCDEPIKKPSVDRKDNSIGYVLENCILICQNCNILKANTHKHQIKNIYLHLFGDVKPSDLQT